MRALNGIGGGAGRGGARQLLRRGASGAFLVQIGGAGLGLLAHLVIARLLGAAEYGVYSFTLSWVAVLSVVALFGQDTSVVRFLPAYAHRGEWGAARGLRRGASAIVLMVSMLIAVTGTVVVLLFGARLSHTLERTLFAGFLLLPVLTQLQLSGALHCALKRAVSSGIFNLVMRPIALIVLVIAVSLGIHWTLSAPAAVLASTAASAVALGFSSWALSRAWPKAARDSRPSYEVRIWAGTGAQLLLLSVMVIIEKRLDVLLLGALGGVNAVGPYYAALTMATFALYGLNAANVALAPLIAERYSANDFGGLEKVARGAARIAFSIALVACVVFAGAGHSLLMLFGPGFSSAYSSLLILLFGYLVSTSFGEVGFMLAMTQYQKHAAVFVAAGIAANSMAAVVLIPRFGMVGAAVAAAAGIVIWRGLALAYVIARMRVNPSIFGRERGEGATG